MKFDFVIGNPPYQENTEGTSLSDKPVYNLFIDEAYKISNKVEMITPGRFLFDAGATPSSWNKKMLNDMHLKVLNYERDGEKIFPSTDIKGGVAITYRDTTKNFGAIEIFTIYPELNSILKKIIPILKTNNNLSDIIYNQTNFNLRELNNDFPNIHRKDRRLESNIFSLPVFKENESKDNDFEILGVVKNKRLYRYINKKYINIDDSNIFMYKVMFPKSYGKGSFGEELSSPVIGVPSVGYTRTFISVGAFTTENEAVAAMKYLKSKFVRALISVLKVTQNAYKQVYKMVPIQDFTEHSDIDWSVSISNIDKQLYKKYELSQEEIDFIESNVKGME